MSAIFSFLPLWVERNSDDHSLFSRKREIQIQMKVEATRNQNESESIELNVKKAISSHDESISSRQCIVCFGLIDNLDREDSIKCVNIRSHYLHTDCYNLLIQRGFDRCIICKMAILSKPINSSLSSMLISSILPNRALADWIRGLGQMNVRIIISYLKDFAAICLWVFICLPFICIAYVISIPLMILLFLLKCIFRTSLMINLFL